LAREGRRHLDDGLVGLHRDHRLVGLERIARLHVPLDDLGFLQALAEVGQVEDPHYWYSITLRAAPAMRAASGMYFSSSRNIGVTVSKAVTRSTGASRDKSACSEMLAEISEARLQVRGASVITTQWPVFFTEASTVSKSMGLSVARSITSAATPSASSSSAAASASCSIAPHATKVTSVPARTTNARSRLSGAPSSGTSSLKRR